MELLIGCLNIRLSLILVDEVYDLFEGLLWVRVSDTILAFIDDEISDFSLIVEDCLPDCNVIVSASKLNPHKLPLLKLIFDSLVVGKTFDEAN